MESEVKDLEEQRKMKCEEFNGLEKKIVELETRIQDKDAEIASFEDQKILLIEQIKNLSSEKNDLAFNLKIAETKLETHERLVEELREYKLQLEEDNQKQKVENDSLMAEKCGIESELMCLKEENEKLKRDRTALAEVTDRKNYYKDNCLRLDKLCAELNDENASLKNDFNEIHNVLQDKEKKIEEYVLQKL